MGLLIETVAGSRSIPVADPGGARGGYSPPPPPPRTLKIHSILCMGVLGDNTISTAVHQVVNYVHVPSMAECMAGPSKKAKFKIYRQSESLFDHFSRLGTSQSASCSFCVVLEGFPMQKALASGAEPQTPMGELPALPHTP